MPDTKRCPFCAETIKTAAVKCRFCGEQVIGETAQWAAYRARYEALTPAERREAWIALTLEQRTHLSALTTQGAAASQASPASSKSDVAAFFLGFFLGPVGLWYKEHWVAGFAWLAMAVVAGLSGIGLILVPVFWFGMAIHAAAAKSKG